MSKRLSSTINGRRDAILLWYTSNTSNNTNTFIYVWHLNQKISNTIVPLYSDFIVYGGDKLYTWDQSFMDCG